MKLLIVLLLVVSVDLILGSVHFNTHFMDAPQRLCGSQLTAELAIQCQGWYNDDTRIQRQRIKRGVVDECCTIPCTRRYLKNNYCGTPPKTTTTPEITTTTESRIKPVDYSMYYYALINRVKAEPKDYPRH